MNRSINRKIFKILIALVILIGLFLFYRQAWIIGQEREAAYKYATQLVENGSYQSALKQFLQLRDFKDSAQYVVYLNAIQAFNEHQYQLAIEEFSRLGNFLDSEAYIKSAENSLKILSEQDSENQRLYDEASEYYKKGQYSKACKLFKSLGTYRDSQTRFEECSNISIILKNSTTISAGISSSAGVTSDGKVFLSGKKVLRPSDVSDWTDIISVSTMGSLIIGLKIDGTVVTAGTLDNNKYYRIETGNWNDIVAVSAGDLYILGLRKDGTIVAQGYNNYGQMDVDNWRNITAISTGWRLTVGLDTTGDIHITGRYAEEILEEIENDKEDWKNLVAVSAGGGRTRTAGEYGHVVALKSDHTVVAAGDNRKGQCNVNGEDWNDIIAISAGAYHTVGLKADGTVVTTQTAPEIVQEIEKWNETKDIVAISAGYGFTLGLKANGEVVGSGFFYDNIRDTDDWENIAYYTDEWQSIFDDKNG